MPDRRVDTILNGKWFATVFLTPMLLVAPRVVSHELARRFARGRNPCVRARGERGARFRLHDQPLVITETSLKDSPPPGVQIPWNSPAIRQSPPDRVRGHREAVRPPASPRPRSTIGFVQREAPTPGPPAYATVLPAARLPSRPHLRELRQRGLPRLLLPGSRLTGSPRPPAGQACAYEPGIPPAGTGTLTVHPELFLFSCECGREASFPAPPTQTPYERVCA